MKSQTLGESQNSAGCSQGTIILRLITTQNSSPTSSWLALSGSTGGTGGVYRFTAGEGVAGAPSAVEASN